MHWEKIHNKGQAQIFRNQYMEYLTKTHPLVIWGMYLPINIVCILYASRTYHFSAWQIGSIFLGGIFFWSLFEYIMHRFVFHWAGESPWAKRVSYILHGNHHEFPRDKQRLFMPPVPSLIIAAVIFVIFYAFMGNHVFPFFPGFILGYLLYGSMHYAIHAWHPPFKWLKPIWRNHHLHHYKNDEKGFGVSSHIWDKVFNTGFDLESEKENKEAVRKVMFEK